MEIYHDAHTYMHTPAVVTTNTQTVTHTTQCVCVCINLWNAFILRNEMRKLCEMVHLLHYQVAKFSVIRNLKIRANFCGQSILLYTPKLIGIYLLRFFSSISHSLRVNNSIFCFGRVIVGFYGRTTHRTFPILLIVQHRNAKGKPNGEREKKSFMSHHTYIRSERGRQSERMKESASERTKLKMIYSNGTRGILFNLYLLAKCS